MGGLRQLIDVARGQSLRRRLGWILPALFLGGASVSLFGQTDDELILDWARTHGIRLSTVEPERSFTDLQDVRPLLESARVVALGEPMHGAHEPLALRNRLFEFLVEELDFTAIAVETGFTEAWAVNDYVHGLGGDASVTQHVFSWASHPRVEHQQLIDWMRDYNSRPSTTRQIRFYGLDLSGGRQGSRTWISSTRRSVTDSGVILRPSCPVSTSRTIRRSSPRNETR